MHLLSAGFSAYSGIRQASAIFPAHPYAPYYNIAVHAYLETCQFTAASFAAIQSILRLRHDILYFVYPRNTSYTIKYPFVLPENKRQRFVLVWLPCRLFPMRIWFSRLGSPSHKTLYDSFSLSILIAQIVAPSFYGSSRQNIHPIFLRLLSKTHFWILPLSGFILIHLYFTWFYDWNLNRICLRFHRDQT